MSLVDATVGAMFLGAAALWWLGWVLLPVKIGEFFVASDFAAVHRSFHAWIWLFRIHLFGYLVAVMALVAFATLYTEHTARVLIWPATAVACAGLVVGCLAAAFYYHFGAWGALELHGQPEDAAVRMVASLKVPTEYVTCLVRFGRVFFGLGQVLLGAGMLVAAAAVSWDALGPWLAVAAILLGIAAMALTMGRPDDLHLYHPLFHLNAIWLVAMGVLRLL